MFGIGMSEMIVIAVIALIFIGPDQIPEVARTVGRFLNDLKRSSDDLKQSFHDQTGLPKTLEDLTKFRIEDPKPLHPTVVAEPIKAELPDSAVEISKDPAKDS